MTFEEEFCLDWKKDRLEGWEKHVSSLVVTAMIEGIRLGHVFPPAYVSKVGKNFYQLAKFSCYGYDGGHHRAVAHYNEDVPLLCKIVRKINLPKKGLDSIGEIIMRDKVYKFKLGLSLKKLPLENALGFCKKHKINPDVIYNNSDKVKMGFF